MRSTAFDSAGPSRPDPSGGAVVRLALAFAAATNGLILSPFLVAAVMTRFRLDDGAATALVSVEILGIAISCALLPRRIACAARPFTLAGALGAIAGQALSAVAPGIVSAGAARGLTGLFEGMLFVVVASGVSQRASTERLWGQINLLAGGINGGILVLVSALPAAWLGRWIFALLAGVLAVFAPAIRGIDAFAAQPAQPVPARPRDVPFLTGMLSDVDPDGSLVARTLVVTFFAAGIGTALSGALLERYGGARVAHVLGAAVLAAAPFVRLALRRAPPAGAPGGVGHPLR
ncbi:hypothetical protein WL76_30055 [Burkholderia ubonensis]|uniref:hypothetical protein n=1 Tax=Burkholderia ubonensis TaxID=101571 RepID=UPI00075D04C0|nr:hypothetical protein [Burkholderia ubonensis]KWE45524.1 hypothetical protein WL76_30055 [Burkholderia ubonensis]